MMYAMYIKYKELQGAEMKMDLVLLHLLVQPVLVNFIPLVNINLL